jgi:hypothetical protein
MRKFYVAILIVMLMITLVPTGAAQAQEPTVSDLAVSLVSIPKHAKACETFEAVYTVTNRGPDPASHLWLGVGIPDAYDVVEIVGLPDSLAVGESATVTVFVRVVAFVPGEMRYAWVNVDVASGNVLEPSTDPNPDNNSVVNEMKLIGKRSMESCPAH